MEFGLGLSGNGPICLSGDTHTYVMFLLRLVGFVVRTNWLQAATIPVCFVLFTL